MLCRTPKSREGVALFLEGNWEFAGNAVVHDFSTCKTPPGWSAEIGGVTKTKHLKCPYPCIASAVRASKKLSVI
jgi:hypothetical protein